MKELYDTNRLGFTLVELSIVLVIIGLLIGGILVGQSLVDSARINSTVSEINQIKIAIQQFDEKFRCLPGDCPNSKLGGMNSCGDDDGYIGYIHGICTEHYNAWYQMSELGFLAKWNIEYRSGSSGNIAGINYPTSVLAPERLGYGFGYDDTDKYLRMGVHVGSHVEVSSNKNSQTADSVTPIDALILDKKIDDGLPLTGEVIATRQGTGGYPIGCAQNYNDNVYLTDDTPSKNCAIVFTEIHD